MTPVRGRVVGLVVLPAFLGLGGGWVLVGLDARSDAAAGPASPLAASSPSVPVTTEEPYAADGGPPLGTVEAQVHDGRRLARALLRADV